MAKLGNPFKDKAIRITQTTHNHLGGHSDFTMVRAIDCNAEPFDNRVYAEGDGIVIASINSSNPNSYLHIRYDGMPSHILREFVHCRPSVAKGARIKRGQLVGTLEPYRANWYGTGKHHAVHLHWSFLNTNKTGAPNPFNYLVRTTKVTTNAAVIKNHRTWFNSNGTFNWSSFGDYKLDIKTPAPTPPSCEAEQKQIKALQAQIKALNKEIANYKNIEDSLLEENESLKKETTEFAEYLVAKDKEIEELKKDRDWLAEHVAERDEELNAKAMEIQVLKEKIKQLEEEKTCTLETLRLGDFIRWIGMQFGIGKK